MRQVVIVTYPGGQSLDITGPLEVFSVASRILEADGQSKAGYRLRVASMEAGPLRMSSGLQLVAEVALSKLRGELDTLLVAGGEGTRQAMFDPRLQRALRRLAPRVRRLGSVCSGAFCLAEAGLLRDRRATTHWEYCAALAERYPEVTVEADAIFVHDGQLWTSAGVTAGIDMALSLVEADHGHALSLRVARQLVMFVRRPGGQSQFSETLRAQSVPAQRLAELPAYIADHLDADLSVEQLAARVRMSPRTFARTFRRELGDTPARYVERVRVEAARRLLTDGGGDLARIADRTGFASAEVLRRAFQRQLRVSPRHYRQHFAAASP